MSSIKKVLVQQTHLDIFSCDRRTNIDIKGWIANQNYYIDEDLTLKSFSLRASDKDYLKASLANDCNRMAMAAIESISGIKTDDIMNKSGAWGIIRSYYAAFFSIHSIMRMFGISCSQLEQDHVDKIYELSNIFGKTGSISKLEKGFYSIEIDKSFTNVQFYKYKDSHKDTWERFLILLEKLKDQSISVSSLSNYKIEAIDILYSIKKGITRSHCGKSGNWLSVIRNSVNYQQSHGVWYPYEKRPVAPSYINKIASEWTKRSEDLKSSLTKSDIETFFEIVLMISALFRELLIGCSCKANNKNKTFVNGCLRLLNSIKV